MKQAGVYFFLVINLALFNSGVSEPLNLAMASEEALALINLPNPVFRSEPPVADEETLKDMGLEQIYKNKDIKFSVRDGIKIHADYYSMKSDIAIILLHGAVGSSYSMNRMAGLLRESAKAEVYAMDLRGHGLSEGRPGDVDYIGQYADDLEDVLAQIKRAKPQKTLIVAGYSMGGGVALGFLNMKTRTQADAYLLFAPDLGSSSQTMRKEIPVRMGNKEPVLKLHMGRIVGLHMLNQQGIHLYDHLPVTFYNLPAKMPVRQYSYRSLLSTSPADYRPAIRHLKEPLLVIVGTADEAFIAEEFPAAINQHSDAEVFLVTAATHNSIRHSKIAMNRVREWSRKYF